MRQTLMSSRNFLIEESTVMYQYRYNW